MIAMLQNCVQTPSGTKLFFCLIFGLFHLVTYSQTITDRSDYRNRIDSLFQKNEYQIQEDSSSQLTRVWMDRANILASIMEDVELKEKYKQIDFQVEYSRTLRQALKLDKKKEYKEAIETNFASSTIDLANLALVAMENARRYKSVADAEKAVELFELSLSDYKQTGSSQKVVDDFWKNDGLNWQWMRFYKGVSLRMAEKKGDAENEYTGLIKLGWYQSPVFLETADLQLEVGKNEEAQKTLIMGHDKLPGNISIACALTRLYLKTDQLKKAQLLIKPYDNELGNNAELVMTKALVYEKKGDLKKADALMKAVYQSDNHEVIINTTYAGYLMRKASNAEKFDAEEFAQLAYNLIHKASELSPNNEELKIELDAIKFKYPKVRLEEND